MGSQLTLFGMTDGEALLKARQTITCRRCIIDLRGQLKEAQTALRECAEATKVKDIKADIKSAVDAKERLESELDAAALHLVDANTGEVSE